MSLTLRRGLSWVLTLASLATLAVGITHLPGAGNLASEICWLYRDGATPADIRRADGLLLLMDSDQPGEMSPTLLELLNDTSPSVVERTLRFILDRLKVDASRESLKSPLVSAHVRKPFKDWFESASGGVLVAHCDTVAECVVNMDPIPAYGELATHPNFAVDRRWIVASTSSSRSEPETARLVMSVEQAIPTSPRAPALHNIPQAVKDIPQPEWTTAFVPSPQTTRVVSTARQLGALRYGMQLLLSGPLPPPKSSGQRWDEEWETRETINLRLELLHGIPSWEAPPPEPTDDPDLEPPYRRASRLARVESDPARVADWRPIHLDVADYLGRLLNDPIPRVRWGAALILVVCRDQRGLPAFCDWLQHNPRFTTNANKLMTGLFGPDWRTHCASGSSASQPGQRDGGG